MAILQWEFGAGDLGRLTSLTPLAVFAFLDPTRTLAADGTSLPLTAQFVSDIIPR
jgi:hypothetical protein